MLYLSRAPLTDLVSLIIFNGGIMCIYVLFFLFVSLLFIQENSFNTNVLVSHEALT